MPLRLHIAIALGLAAGLALGLAASISGSPALLLVADWLEPLGEMFVNLLKMVVLPLIASVIFVGVSSLGDLRRLGRMGTITVAFLATAAILGVLTGMAIMALLLPWASEAAIQTVAPTSVEATTALRPVQFLLDLIPSNPFEAAAEGALLPLILFTVLVAAAAGALPQTERDLLHSLAHAVAAALIKLVHWILWLAPVGVFALAAPVTARSGWAVLQSLIMFVVAVLVGLIVFVGSVYLATIKFLARRRLRPFLRACMSPQAISAAATSSPAAVPAMLEAADELIVSRPVAGFVIPLGAGIGRGGSAVFQGAGIVFLAWLYGVPLVAAGIGGAVLATFIVSFAVASIPGGSVLSMAPAMSTVGIPLDGLTILLSVDRIPDMARTATNVTGTMTATVLVDRFERDVELLQHEGTT
ncbi:MAG: dicarboxylate/amino acid:cation symporter [Gemmatimonadota bacterium]|nr:MAG: dicarboxylate/amino acid:cation symporter [Gemmatimonadota bacterium]